MSEPFLGEIRLVAFATPPAGWALCDGRLLHIAEHRELYSLLGTVYGGDGRVTFALPDLRSRVPVGAGQGLELRKYERGDCGGSETVTITAAELPPHHHPVRLACSPILGNSIQPEGRVPAEGSRYGDTPSAWMRPGGAEATGGGNGQPHANLQPYLTLTYMIALEGSFPKAG
jgi:microcystin-dependent protein